MQLRSIGYGFFCGIHGANILIYPVLFKHTLSGNFSIIDFVLKICIFWISLIGSLIIKNTFINVFVFLLFVYGQDILSSKKKTTAVKNELV